MEDCPQPEQAWRFGDFVLNATLAAEYAKLHDDAIWQSAEHILDAQNIEPDIRKQGRQRAELPLRLGGLGLSSGVRSRHAAHWASWADTLPMIRARNAGAAQAIYDELRDETPGPTTGCIRDVTESKSIVVEKGYDECPFW